MNEPNGVTPGGARPATAYSFRRTLAGTAVLAAVVVAGIAAASYPGFAAGGVVTLLALAVGRRAHRAVSVRRSDDGGPAVCVPAIGVCIEA